MPKKNLEDPYKTQQIISDEALKNWCFIMMILGIIGGLWALILFTIFFADSRDWNYDFMKVLTLEQELLDQTTLAITDVHTMTDKTNKFMDENPDFLQSIQSGLQAFSNILKPEAKDQIIHILDWIEVFINSNSDPLNNIIKEGYNITHFIMEVKTKLEEKRKFEISF